MGRLGDDGQIWEGNGANIKICRSGQLKWTNSILDREDAGHRRVRGTYGGDAG